MGQKDTKPRKARARPGGKAVLGKPGIESLSFGIVLAGTEVAVTVRYTPPYRVASSQWWPLALVDMEVSNMAACLNDLDETAAHIVKQFTNTGGKGLSRWQVRGWFQAQPRPEAPRPVAVPQASSRRDCARCGGLMPSAYPGEDPTCLICGWVEYAMPPGL